MQVFKHYWVVMRLLLDAMARLEPLDEVDAVVDVVEEHDVGEDEVEATNLIALTITHVFIQVVRALQ